MARSPPDLPHRPPHSLPGTRPHSCSRKPLLPSYFRSHHSGKPDTIRWPQDIPVCRTCVYPGDLVLGYTGSLHLLLALEVSSSVQVMVPSPVLAHCGPLNPYLWNRRTDLEKTIWISVTQIGDWELKVFFFF